MPIYSGLRIPSQVDLERLTCAFARSPLRFPFLGRVCRAHARHRETRPLVVFSVCCTHKSKLHRNPGSTTHAPHVAHKARLSLFLRGGDCERRSQRERGVRGRPARESAARYSWAFPGRGPDRAGEPRTPSEFVQRLMAWRKTALVVRSSSDIERKRAARRARDTSLGLCTRSSFTISSPDSRSMRTCVEAGSRFNR
jgi:hypothetical protein